MSAHISGMHHLGGRKLYRALHPEAMLLSLASAAWAWEPAEPVMTPVGVVAAVLVSSDGVVTTGPDGTFLVRGGVSSRVGAGGVALALADLDQDGVDDVLTCGPEGLYWLDPARAGSGGVLRTAPCLAVVANAGGVVVAGGDGLERLVDGSWVRVSDVAYASPLLALLEDRVAVAERGSSVVAEVSSRGTSTFTTRGAVVGLQPLDGRFAWTVSDPAVVSDVAGQQVPLAPQPGASAVADLDGDGASEWLVAHGVDRVGVVSGGVERIYAFAGVRALAGGDLDGDGCGDLVVGTDAGVAIASGRCEAVAQAPRMPRRLRFDACTAMAGVAFGGTYATSWDTVGDSPWQPSISPALAIACELAGPIRLFGGLDSAVTFRYAVRDDLTGSHVFGVSGGFLYGGERFRIGPIGTVGTVLLGAGARALWLPFGGDGRTYRGFEARVLGLGPTSSPVPAVEVMLMYGVELRELR